MTLANVLYAWSASKSGRNLLDANVMPSPCSVLVACVWAVLLSHNACPVESLKGGKEVDNAIIRAVGGDRAADVWVPRFVFNHKTICAGVTLTAEADLTSATCLKDDEPLEAFVVVESHGHDDPPVQVAFVNRCVKFDEADQHVHDLMVCFHHCRWNFSDDVFVPPVNLDSDRVLDKTCSVIGFGHMTPDGDKCNVLHTVEISVGTSQDCGSQDNTVQNYICGATTEHQESCAVDGGEPLLCQHNGSQFFVQGICKQEDCSAPQKYSKFILLTYYREWLERTVPGLAPSSGSREDTSSHGEEGETKSEESAGIVAPEQNNQKSDRAGDEAEKCPLLPHPPPVHIHHHSPTREEQTDQVMSESSDDTSWNSAAPNFSQSGNGAASDISASAGQDSGGTARQALSSAEVRPAHQDSSRAAQSDHDPVLAVTSAGNGGFDSDAALSPAASDKMWHSTLSGSRDVAGDISRRESLPGSVPEKSSHSGNSELGKATLRNTPPADDEVPRNTTPVQTSPGDPAAVVPWNSADSVLNATVLLASLGDSWYLSNATRSAPHLSDSNEKLDLDRLEKLISENAAVLNFSYVVDGTNLSLPGYRNRSVETAPKLLSSTGNELAKPGADSPNSIPSNKAKSPDSAEKPGKIPGDSSKPQNVLPSGGVTPVQETGRVSHTDSPRDNATSSATPLQNLPTEPPRLPAINRTASPNTLALSPTQWDWLKQNAMRIPKNPLKNPKVLNKKLLFKLPRRKNDTMSKAKEQTPSSESSGFPTNYRNKWSAQALSSYRLHPLYNSLEDDVKTPQTDRSHPPGKGVPSSGVPSRTVRDDNFLPITVSRATPSRSHDRLSGGRTRKSLPSKEMHSGRAVDTRIWRNPIDRAGLSRDVQRDTLTLSSPTPTAGRKEERQLSPYRTNWRQPEGTFFGVLSSSVKTRLKRSGEDDEPSEWKTLLADLASWPARVGIPRSQLTPHMSFLTAVNETSSDLGPMAGQSFYTYFKILRAFLPGGSVARRLDLYKKKLIWGPPITYNEFTPIRPGPVNVGQEEAKPEEENREVVARFDADENEDSTTEALETRQYVPDEAVEPAPTVSDEGVLRQEREVKNDFPTTPGAGMKHGADGDSISAELGVKKENHTAVGHNSSYNGSKNVTNVSGQPDSEIAVGTIHTEKETVLSTVDIAKETTLSADDTQKETELPTVNTRNEATIPAADTGKVDKTTLSTVSKENDTLLSTADVQKEKTLSKVDAGREATGEGEIVSTPRSVDTGKLNLRVTVRRTIKMEEPDDEKNSTPIPDDDREIEVQDPEDQSQEHADIYEDIKRLGADESMNAAPRLSPISGVVLTLVLMWISMPQI